MNIYIGHSRTCRPLSTPRCRSNIYIYIYIIIGGEVFIRVRRKDGEDDPETVTKEENQ